MEEDKKKLALDLILGWTHTKVSLRSQEVEEDKKRLGQVLILGWNKTKVREVRR